MVGYIYKTTNILNNKIYIGKRQKQKFDASYIGSGKKLKSAIKHYGKENFNCEIIEWCKTREQLNIREIFWINYFKAQDPTIGYNLATGGEGGDLFHTLSEADQSKFKKHCKINGHKHKGKYRIYKGTDMKLILPDELDSYLADGWLRGLPPELAQRQGLARAGRKHSKQWVERLKVSQLNRYAKMSEEQRQKLAENTRQQMAKLSQEEKHELAMRGVAARLKKRQGKKLIWVNKNGTKKYIDEKDWEEYSAQGWKRGMK